MQDRYADACAYGFPPPIDGMWFDAWRTTPECTGGGLGFSCALEPLVSSLFRARQETSSALLCYGDSSMRHSEGDAKKREEWVAVPPIKGIANFHWWLSHNDTRWSLSRHPRRSLQQVASESEKNRESSCDEVEDDWDQPLPVLETACYVSYPSSRRCPENSSTLGETKNREIGVEKTYSDSGESEDKSEDEALGYDGRDGVGSDRKNGQGDHLVCFPGDILHNRYMLLRLLDSGFMSRVWLAVDLDRYFAIPHMPLHEVGEEPILGGFSVLDTPLLVAIKVFRCSAACSESADYEALVLAYVNECNKVRLLQEMVLITDSMDTPDMMSIANPLKETLNDDTVSTTQLRGSLFSVSGCGRKKRNDSSSSGSSDNEGVKNDVVQLPAAGHIASLLERFEHIGLLGIHQCIVMRATGASVDAVMKEMVPQGLPERMIRGIIRSTLEGLALLAAMGIVHNNIRPDNLLFVKSYQEVSSDVRKCLARYFESFLPIASQGQVTYDKRFMKGAVPDASCVVDTSSSVGVTNIPLAGCHEDADGILERPLGDGDEVHQRQEISLGSNMMYSVQLSNFSHSYLVLPRRQHIVGGTVNEDCNRRDDSVETADDVASSGDDNCSYCIGACTAMTSNASVARTSMPPLLHSYRPELRVNLQDPSPCSMSVAGELKREILARKRCCVSRSMQSREYRAPELILGHMSGTAVDVWSLGCIAFELVTGRLLFDPVGDVVDNVTCGIDWECPLVAHRHTEEGDTNDTLRTMPHFDQRTKYIDMLHLRSIALLLGAPEPVFLLSPPVGKFVGDFFDANGHLIFLNENERDQLYGSNNREPAGASVVDAPSTTSANATSTQSYSEESCGSVPPFRNYNATPGWLRVRKEIQKRLGADNGMAFEDFLLKCLRWDAEKRQSADALLMDPWVTNLGLLSCNSIDS